MSVELADIPRRVKEAVLRFDPEAQVILYGSRARGDAQPDSDWDFLVLLKRMLTHGVQECLRDALYDIELETGDVIVPLFRTIVDWDLPLRKATPFYQNVTREGIAV